MSKILVVLESPNKESKVQDYLGSKYVVTSSKGHIRDLDPNSLSDEIVNITHFNLNDKTVAGLELIGKPIFSVQYHPEASPGPHDSSYLFEEFYKLIDAHA